MLNFFTRFFYPKEIVVKKGSLQRLKFIKHKNGIMLLFARTDTKWFHNIVCKADAILFKKGRIAFELEGQDGGGKAIDRNMFVASGDKGIEAIKNIEGLFIDLRNNNNG